jgi:osmotically-inducible protein OsmY
MLSPVAVDDGRTLAHVDGGAAAHLKRSIEGMLVRNARLDAADLSIQIWKNGVISLSGTVDSWADHDSAIAAAWAAPGATAVHDHLRVEY